MDVQSLRQDPRFYRVFDVWLKECVRLFCTERSVLSTPLIKIYKKPNIKQADIKNFAWNIGNVYGYPLDLTAQFVCATFPAWFANTERTTVERTLRTTRGQVNIEIDPNLLSHLEKSNWVEMRP